METIVYGKALGKKEAGGALSRRMRETFRIPYAVRRREAVFLGRPVVAYLIEGADAASFASWEASRGVERRRGESNRVGRTRATIRVLQRRLQKEEIRRKKAHRAGNGGENMTYMSDNAIWLCNWREDLPPTELSLRFYQERRRSDPAVRHAEQLIVLDGAENRRSAERENELIEKLYDTYNTITIVTAREAAWTAFADMAYEEYGIIVRCARDSAGLRFAEKRTLAVDLSGKIPDCLRTLPGDCVYLDLAGGAKKQRYLAVKRPRISYVSLYRALDTAITDTV